MNQKESSNSVFSLIVLTSLFFMWGFITVLNDILVPYLKGVFSLTYTEANLIQFAFFGAYFIGSLAYFLISSSIGDPINKIGYKNGIFIGLTISAVGTSLFYPAAHFESYSFFLAALFVLGLGFTMLQITANPYVAIIGSPETASSRLNLSQGFNSLGTTLAPLIGGYLIFHYFIDANSSGPDSVKIPYLIYSCIFLVLALIIKFIHLPEFSNQEHIEKGVGALKYRHLALGVIAIFFYVGGEVSIGTMMISFLGLPDIAGLPKESASKFVSFYWGGLMIGRFIGSISLSNLNSKVKNMLIFIIPIISFLVIWGETDLNIAGIYSIFLVLSLIGFYIGKNAPNKTLYIFSIFALALLIAAITGKGHIAMWSLIGVGLFNSIMWSNIFTLAIDGLGKYTSQGSSLLVMAIVGGAILPLAQGALADNFSIQLSLIVPVFSYIYIAFYGLIGYKKIINN